MATNESKPITNLESLLTKAAVSAFDGTMQDDERLGLYKLAMSVASNELYRVEETHPGAVSTEALLLLQQLALLCDPETTPEHLKGSIERVVNHVKEEEGIG